MNILLKHVGFSMVSLAALTLVALASQAQAELQISEVMYNPIDEDVWEWVEIRNTGASDVDMDGWLAFNLGDGELTSPTPTIVSNPNSPNTVVPAGGATIVYDGFHGAGQPGTFDDAQFREAWNLDASVPLMAGNFFPSLSNSEGSPSQSIAFWATLEDYQADLVDDGTGTGDREVGGFANAQVSINYADALYPAADGMSSMTWSGQGDIGDGATWVLSQAGTAGAATSEQVIVGGSSNSVNEVANPGLVTSSGSAPSSALMITEMMYDAAIEPDWEWVEIYNPGMEAVDLSGWVIDDINSVSHEEANIAAGAVPAGGTAILFNVDDTPESDFATAWGAGLNLVPVTDWGAMQLNNGGDTIGLWSDFASYEGDHETHANAVLSIAYTDDPDFPDSNNMSSITLNDLGADIDDGLSWDLSFIGDLIGSFNPDAVGDMVVFHPGGDVGSPGTFIVQELPTDNPDFDDDGDVDGADFLAIQSADPALIPEWENQFGQESAAAAVPEPTTGWLIVLGSLAWAARRRAGKR